MILEMPVRDAGRPAGTLTLKEGAVLMGRSLKATRRAAKVGEIPAIRWGRSYLVLREPLERLLRGEALPHDD
jgi:excisionase family DNA binding protein